MNLAHVHIVLNHVPSLGSIAGLVLLAAAIRTRNDGLRKFSFQLLVLVAISLLPTYITGAEAQRMVRDSPVVSKAMIQVHQNAAMVTLLAMTLTGTLAWFGLWQMRRFSRPGSLTSAGTLVAALATVILILGTANVGGKISHGEIREDADKLVTVEEGWREPIELFVSDHSWIWPAGETVHFIGMCMLFGMSLLFLMRMLGGVRSIPFSALHRLMPVGILGFVLNVLTGMMFFIAGPGLYLGKNAFHVKMACIILATVPLLYFTFSSQPWNVDSEKTSTATSKLAAVSTFALIVAVVIYGRLLPFLN